jgi:hypothetical protein
MMFAGVCELDADVAISESLEEKSRAWPNNGKIRMKEDV